MFLGALHQQTSERADFFPLTIYSWFLLVSFPYPVLGRANSRPTPRATGNHKTTEVRGNGSTSISSNPTQRRIRAVDLLMFPRLNPSQLSLRCSCILPIRISLAGIQHSHRSSHWSFDDSAQPPLLVPHCTVVCRLSGRWKLRVADQTCETKYNKLTRMKCLYNHIIHGLTYILPRVIVVCCLVSFVQWILMCLSASHRRSGFHSCRGATLTYYHTPTDILPPPLFLVLHISSSQQTWRIDPHE